jgi:hypothetical protein
MIPNANAVTSSFDRISGTILFPKYQPITNFRIQTVGANIIQGQVNKLSLTELMMSYDIPTVISGKNAELSVFVRQFPVGAVPTVITIIPVILPTGFYTAAEMVAAITAGIGGGTNLSCTLNTTNNCISFNNVSTWNPAATNYVYEIVPAGGGNGSPGSGLTDTNVFNKPDLLFSAGFRNLYAENSLKENNISDSLYHPISLVPIGMPAATIALYCPNGGYQAMTGSSYSGAYTQYIDIVSPSLTQAQYVRDSTTSQATAKKDVIARVYVSDNTSLAVSNNIGARPFVIHRMFPCPKVMKWTVDRSLDAIQLELYDQFGQPLPIPNSLSTGFGSTPASILNEISSGIRDYAITLHVHEHDETTEPNVGYRY